MIPWRRVEHLEHDAHEASHGWVDVAAGLEVYRRATEEHPRDPDVWVLYSGAFAALDRWSEAERTARAGLEAAGFDPDLDAIVLDALLAQQQSQLVRQELDRPAPPERHPIVAPVYRARAAEVAGAPADEVGGLLADAYDVFCAIAQVGRAPQQILLDLGEALARQGLADEADHVFEVVSRGNSPVALEAAADGAALWAGRDGAMEDQYLDRLAKSDLSDDELTEAIDAAEAAVTPPEAAPADDG